MRRVGERKNRMGAALAGLVLLAAFSAGAGPVWPPPPDPPRVEYVGEILSGELKPETSFLGRIGRFLGGGSDDEKLTLPFAILPVEGMLYLTCQDFPALVRVNLEEGSYKLFRCDDLPLQTPVGLAAGAGYIFVADSGSGAVYRLDGGDLEVWITEGLSRPTGLAVPENAEALYVVDTGDHSIKMFDFEGRAKGVFGGRGDEGQTLNFPTFATGYGTGILVNDTLNYQVKKYDAACRLLGEFGEEGGGPGTFSRAKGLVADKTGNIWVVDSLFDNIQIFDGEGRLLLIVGGSGQEAGEFWSPAGIGISDDLVYVADTFNNRIQVLKNLGGGS